ncbi:hypothetical protein D4R52_02870, partial [bacterium]
DNTKPKILEQLTQWSSMISKVVGTVVDAGIYTICIVVNGNKFRMFRQGVRDDLDDNGIRVTSLDIRFAHQHWRLGAAQAVELGLGMLPPEIETVLVTYADMPLWRPETLTGLIKRHFSSKAKISLVSVRLTDTTPATVRRYGRVLRDATGMIVGIIEPTDPLSVDIKSVTTVNPSLYVIDRWWLDENLGDIPACDKGDGYPAEFHMPQLLQLAYKQKALVAELPLADHTEALGANTLEELVEVADILDERESQEQVGSGLRP